MEIRGYVDKCLFEKNEQTGKYRLSKKGRLTFAIVLIVLVGSLAVVGFGLYNWGSLSQWWHAAHFIRKLSLEATTKIIAIGSTTSFISLFMTIVLLIPRKESSDGKSWKKKPQNSSLFEEKLQNEIEKENQQTVVTKIEENKDKEITVHNSGKQWETEQVWTSPPIFKPKKKKLSYNDCFEDEPPPSNGNQTSESNVQPTKTKTPKKVEETKTKWTSDQIITGNFFTITGYKSMVDKLLDGQVLGYWQNWEEPSEKGKNHLQLIDKLQLAIKCLKEEEINAENSEELKKDLIEKQEAFIKLQKKIMGLLKEKLKKMVGFQEVETKPFYRNYWKGWTFNGNCQGWEVGAGYNDVGSHLYYKEIFPRSEEDRSGGFWRKKKIEKVEPVGYLWAVDGYYDNVGNNGCYKRWKTTTKWVLREKWQKKVEKLATEALVNEVSEFCKKKQDIEIKENK